ncbi:MAG: hypothetical protein ACM31L_04175 [Actinomycetota bacterium]
MSAVVAAAILVSLPVAAADVKAPSPSTVEVHVEPQAWQVRRAEFARAFNVVNANNGDQSDAKALKVIDDRLTSFEKAPLSFTPMEAMDLYGAFYVPKDGSTKMKELLQMVSAMATLGWYDALRFADESGRAEIVNNEAFFKRAFVLGGDEGTQQLLALLQKHPREAAEAVATGIGLARKVRDNVGYDVRWPTGYGLHRTRCALSGGKDCPKPAELPKDKWDGAFAEAANVVETYYRDNSKKK